MVEFGFASLSLEARPDAKHGMSMVKICVLVYSQQSMNAKSFFMAQ